MTTEELFYSPPQTRSSSFVEVSEIHYRVGHIAQHVAIRITLPAPEITVLRGKPLGWHFGAFLVIFLTLKKLEIGEPIPESNNPHDIVNDASFFKLPFSEAASGENMVDVKPIVQINEIEE